MGLLTLLTRRWVKVGVAVTSITAMALPALALSAPAGASPTPAPTVTCPSIGEDAAPVCGYVITVGPNATDTAYMGSVVGPNQLPYDGSDDVIVGIVNDTDALVSSVTLSGSGDPEGAQDIFGFDGDGMCTEPPYLSWCSTGQQEGEDSSDGTYPLGWDYVGQDNTFSEATDYNVQGTVNFTTPLPPGGSTFFARGGTDQRRQRGLRLRHLSLGLPGERDRGSLHRACTGGDLLRRVELLPCHGLHRHDELG